MLPDFPTLLTFLGAGLMLNLAPGADVMFALASGARGGPRAGIAAALGVSLGCLFHVALTALGVAALMAAQSGLLDLIRWAGAGYLAWLAWRAWQADPAARPVAQAGIRRAIRDGAVTNMLNPKVALFILAFLPQFADPARGAVAPQLLALGGLFAVTGFFVTAAYGALGGAAATWLSARQRLLNRVSALVFAGLALRLVLG